MPSEPDRDSTVDPAVDPDASELEDGPATSVICPLGSVMTDLHRECLFEFSWITTYLQ